MSESISTLLLRNLREVFGQADASKRKAAIAELYAEDSVIILPHGRFEGHDALDRIAGELRSGHPAFVYTPHSRPQATGNAGRLAWGSGLPGQPPAYTGLDVIVERNGKIAELIVFLDSPHV